MASGQFSVIWSKNDKADVYFLMLITLIHRPGLCQRSKQDSNSAFVQIFEDTENGGIKSVENCCSTIFKIVVKGSERGKDWTAKARGESVVVTCNAATLLRCKNFMDAVFF